MTPSNKRLKLPGAHKLGGIALPREPALLSLLRHLAPASVAPAA
jgi:hypothetical protein